MCLRQLGSTFAVNSEPRHTNVVPAWHQPRTTPGIVQIEDRKSRQADLEEKIKQQAAQRNGVSATIDLDEVRSL